MGINIFQETNEHNLILNKGWGLTSVKRRTNMKQIIVRTELTNKITHISTYTAGCQPENNKSGNFIWIMGVQK